MVLRPGTAAWRRRRQDPPLAGYQELCRELAASGPGTFGELDSTGARSVLRRYSDAWFATAKRRKEGDMSARYPRRKRGLVPVRWYHGTFRLDGRVLPIPVARGCPPLAVRLDRDIPYPAGQVRSVTLGYDAGRLYADVTAEVPVAHYPRGRGRTRPGPPGSTWASSTRTPPRDRRGRGCWCPGGRSGRNAGSTCATARAAPAPPPPARPSPGQRGSRRWRQHRRSERKAAARHARRVRQAQHEAAKQVITWAVANRIGTLAVGDPRGVLHLKAAGGTASGPGTGGSGT